MDFSAIYLQVEAGDATDAASPRAQRGAIGWNVSKPPQNRFRQTRRKNSCNHWLVVGRGTNAGELTPTTEDYNATQRVQDERQSAIVQRKSCVLVDAQTPARDDNCYSKRARLTAQLVGELYESTYPAQKSLSLWSRTLWAALVVPGRYQPVCTSTN
jgi:hypothetical protein